MKRVLLVNPPFYRVLGSHYNGMSLGLSYIASTLNAAEHDAWVYNADYANDSTYKTLYRIFEDYSGTRLDFTLANPVIAECVDQITRFIPDWVGYSAYTATLPVLEAVTSEVARRMPGVRQVVGGPHATLDPDTASRLPCVDHVVHGEGEHAMRDLIDERVPPARTIFAQRITDLDALPFPERKMLWQPPYPPPDLAYLSTARGCPWRCAYCASPNIWPKVYSRSPESVIRECREIPRQHDQPAAVNGKLTIPDNNAVYIIDDTFTFNEKRAIAIMQGLDRPWKCEARADTITETLAKAMAAHGCVRAKIGVESGSERILKQINKGETKEEIRQGISLLQKYRVPVTIYLMAGFPGETNDDLQQTIAFAKELRPDYCSISMVAPYYGTKLYRNAKDAGVPVDNAPWECFFHHNDSLLLNRSLSRDLIEELWALCDIKHYV